MARPPVRRPPVQSPVQSFDRELATRPFLAGGSFSIADITLLCVMDFGAGPVHVPTRWTELPHLTAWHRRCSARPSVLAHPNPHIKTAPGDGVAATQERYYGQEYTNNGVWQPRLGPVGGSKL